VRHPHLGALQRRHTASAAALRRPLLLHHPSQGQGWLKPCTDADAEPAICPAPAWWPSQPSPAVAVHLHPGGSSSQIPGLYSIKPGAAEQTPGNHFFSTLQRGFYMPRARCSFPASKAVGPAATAETTSKDRPLTSPPLRSALRGSPVENLTMPLDPIGSSAMVY
jgi:hypothetical protein